MSSFILGIPSNDMKNLLSVTAKTSIGSREKNQDVYYVDGRISTENETQYEIQFEDDNKLHVFAVCDGIGQYQYSGEVAAKALEAIQKHQEKTNENLQSIDLKRWCEEALICANLAIRESKLRGSTTIALLAIYQDEYVFVNSGDSPGYVVTNNNIQELSVRHNMATFKKLLGMQPCIGEECILLHHLGEKEVVYGEKQDKMKDEAQTFILCSDGVTNAFDEETLLKDIQEQQEADYFVEKSSQLENADNCTCIIIRITKAQYES